MGYPFDRVNKATTLAAFVANYRNMKLGNLRIKFTDTVIDKF